MTTMVAVPATGIKRVFAGALDQVGEAREWVLGLLQECDRRDDVALVVTELGANAVIHSGSGRDGGTFTVRLALTTTAVELTVADQGPLSVPAQREPDESGRGLSIVHQLADEYREETAATSRTTRCWFAIASGGSS